MSDARQKVAAMIKRRQQSNKRHKKKAAKRLGPNGIVLQFIEAMDKVVEEAKGPLDFTTGLEREAGLLHDRMRAVDPGVDLEVRWNKEADAENWKDLVVEGVLIKWSKWHRGKHPFSDPEKYIDVGTLFIDGYITED